MKKNREAIKVNAKRWSAYAAAGVAAAFSGQQTAEADITVVEVGQVILDSGPNDGQFDSVFVADFGGAQLAFSHASSAGSGWAAVYGQADAGNFMAVAGVGGAYNYVSNLAYGQNISTLAAFLTNTIGTLAWGNPIAGGQWDGTGGFLAFRFDVGAGTQYGWAELTLDTANPQNVYRLERYAFGDAGDSVFVGEAPAAIPEPTSLAALALGAVGLVAYRRRERSA